MQLILTTMWILFGATGVILLGVKFIAVRIQVSTTRVHSLYALLDDEYIDIPKAKMEEVIHVLKQTKYYLSKDAIELKKAKDVDETIKTIKDIKTLRELERQDEEES